MSLSPSVEIQEILIGSGEVVRKGALVFYHYKGFLSEGSLFDSTALHGRPFECVVGSKKIIPGMSQGLIGMKAGGQRRITIPPELAYGERQIGSKIPPHSTLIFEIELLEVRNREDS